MKKLFTATFFLGLSFLALSNPSLNFQNSRIFNSGTNSQGLAVGDLNGDNKPELVVSNVGQGTIRILQDTGTGIEYGTPITLSTLSSTAVVYLGDLNNDSKLDILVCYSGTGNISIFRNQSTGGTLTSGSFATRQDITVTGVTSTNVGSIEDINGDGLADILIASYNSNILSIFKNTTTVPGSISFQNVSSTSLGAGAGPASVNCADLDNDGKKDIVVSAFAGNSLIIYKNNSSISTFSISLAQSFVSSGGPLNACLGDIDGDGKVDIITSTYSGTSVNIYRNITSGSTPNFNMSPYSISVGFTYLQGVIATDLNYDGRLDIVVNSVQANSVFFFENKSTPGTINSNSFLASYSRTTGTTPIEVRSGDFDGDGKPDIALANYSSGNVHVYKNQSIQGGAYIQTDSLIASKDGNRIKLNLKKGSGTKRMLIARLDSAVSVLPTDTINYLADSNFGYGTHLGNGNYIISIDTADIIYMYNTILGKTYYFACLELVGSGNQINYNTILPARTSYYNINYFYSKSSGFLNDLNSWGSNLDGSGQSPTNFNDSFSVFTIRNNATPSLNGNLTIAGISSGLILGDAVNSYNLIIPSNFTVYADSISIRRLFTTTIQGNLVYNKSFFDSLTTLQYVGSNQQSISGGSMYNLVVTGGQKNLSNHLTVRNNLALIGILNTSIYTLNIGISTTQTGTLTRNNGYIIGNIRRWFNTTNSINSGLFPVGTGAYRPLNIEFTSQPSAGGTLLCSFESTEPGNSGLPLFDFSSGFAVINKTAKNGYWKLIAGNGLTGGSYNLTLTGEGFWGITNVPDIRILKRNPNGIWTLQGTAGLNYGSSVSPIVIRTGMTGYGEFAIGGDSTTDPLPMNWLNYSLKIIDQIATLKWQTTNESNVSHYEIEESLNGIEFQKISEIQASNKMGIQSYQTQLNEINYQKYYKIKSVDFDGLFDYSKILKLQGELENNYIIYPNPSSDQLYIQSEDNIDEISLYNAEGKIVFQEKNSKMIDLKQLECGLYQIIIKFSNGNISKSKIIKN